MSGFSLTCEFELLDDDSMNTFEFDDKIENYDDAGASYEIDKGTANCY